MAASRSFSCSWIKSLLCSIASPHMAEIILQFIIASKPTAANQFKLSDWEFLDRILADLIEGGVAKRLIIRVLNDSDPALLVESVLASAKV